MAAPTDKATLSDLSDRLYLKDVRCNADDDDSVAQIAVRSHPAAHRYLDLPRAWLP